MGHVLGTFAPAEREALDDAVEMAADAAMVVAEEDVIVAMNRFNQKKANGE